MADELENRTDLVVKVDVDTKATDQFAESMTGVGRASSEAASRAGQLSQQLAAVHQQSAGAVDSLRAQQQLVDTLGDKYNKLNLELQETNSTSASFWRGMDSWKTLGYTSLASSVGGFIGQRMGIGAASTLSRIGAITGAASIPLMAASTVAAISEGQRQNNLTYISNAADLGMSVKNLKALQDAASLAKAPMESYLSLMQNLDLQVASLGRGFGVASEEGIKFQKTLASLNIPLQSNSQLMLAQVFAGVKAESDNPQVQAARLRQIFGPGNVQLAMQAMQTSYSADLVGSLSRAHVDTYYRGQSLNEMQERLHNVRRAMSMEGFHPWEAIKYGVKEAGYKVEAALLEPLFAAPVSHEQAVEMARRARARDAAIHGETWVRARERVDLGVRGGGVTASSVPQTDKEGQPVPVGPSRYNPATYENIGGGFFTAISDSWKQTKRLDAQTAEFQEYGNGSLFSALSPALLALSQLGGTFLSAALAPTDLGRARYVGKAAAFRELTPSGFASDEQFQGALEASISATTRGWVGNTSLNQMPGGFRGGASAGVPIQNMGVVQREYELQRQLALKGYYGLPYQLKRAQEDLDRMVKLVIDARQSGAQEVVLGEYGKPGDPDYKPGRKVTMDQMSAFGVSKDGVQLLKDAEEKVRVLQRQVSNYMEVAKYERLPEKERTRAYNLATSTNERQRLQLEREMAEEADDITLREMKDEGLFSDKFGIYHPDWEKAARDRRRRLTGFPTQQYDRQLKAQEIELNYQRRIGRIQFEAIPGREIDIAEEIGRLQAESIQKQGQATGQDEKATALRVKAQEQATREQVMSLILRERQNRFALETQHRNETLSYQFQMAEANRMYIDPRATALENREYRLGLINTQEDAGQQFWGRQSRKETLEFIAQRKKVWQDYDRDRANLAQQDREMLRALDIQRGEAADTREIRRIEARAYPSQSAQTNRLILETQMEGAKRYLEQMGGISNPAARVGAYQRLTQAGESFENRQAQREIELELSRRNFFDNRKREEEAHELRMLEIQGKRLDLTQKSYEAAVKWAKEEYGRTGDQGALWRTVYDASYRRNEQALREREMRREEGRQIGGQVYDALLYGGRTASMGQVMRNFITGQAEVLGRGIFSNLTGMLFTAGIGNLPGLRALQTDKEGTKLNWFGELLQRTVLGASPKNKIETQEQIDQKVKEIVDETVKDSIDDNSESVGLNTEALNRLRDEINRLRDLIKRDSEPVTPTPGLTYTPAPVSQKQWNLPEPPAVSSLFPAPVPSTSLPTAVAAMPQFEPMAPRPEVQSFFFPQSKELTGPLPTVVQTPLAEVQPVPAKLDTKLSWPTKPVEPLGPMAEVLGTELSKTPPLAEVEPIVKTTPTEQPEPTEPIGFAGQGIFSRKKPTLDNYTLDEYNYVKQQVESVYGESPSALPPSPYISTPAELLGGAALARTGALKPIAYGRISRSPIYTVEAPEMPQLGGITTKSGIILNTQAETNDFGSFIRHEESHALLSGQYKRLAADKELSQYTPQIRASLLKEKKGIYDKFSDDLIVGEALGYRVSEGKVPGLDAAQSETYVNRALNILTESGEEKLVGQYRRLLAPKEEVMPATVNSGLESQPVEVAARHSGMGVMENYRNYAAVQRVAQGLKRGEYPSDTPLPKLLESAKPTPQIEDLQEGWQLLPWRSFVSKTQPEWAAEMEPLVKPELQWRAEVPLPGEGEYAQRSRDYAPRRQPFEEQPPRFRSENAWRNGPNFQPLTRQDIEVPVEARPTPVTSAPAKPTPQSLDLAASWQASQEAMDQLAAPVVSLDWEQSQRGMESYAFQQNLERIKASDMPIQDALVAPVALGASMTVGGGAVIGAITTAAAIQEKDTTGLLLGAAAMLPFMPRGARAARAELSPAEQLAARGITAEQRTAYKPGISDLLYRGIEPVSYQHKATQIVRDAFFGRQQHAQHAREDAWRFYLGKPQENQTFAVSPFRPDFETGHAVGTAYRMPEFWQKMFPAPEYSKSKSLIEWIESEPNGSVQTDWQMGVMGNYRLRGGKDERGTFLSYYDRWDLDKNPIEGEKGFFGKPFTIYDRLYYDKPKQKIYWDGPPEPVPTKLIDTTFNFNRYAKPTAATLGLGLGIGLTQPAQAQSTIQPPSVVTPQPPLAEQEPVPQPQFTEPVSSSAEPVSSVAQQVSVNAPLAEVQPIMMEQSRQLTPLAEAKPITMSQQVTQPSVKSDEKAAVQTSQPQTQPIAQPRQQPTSLPLPPPQPRWQPYTPEPSAKDYASQNVRAFYQTTSGKAISATSQLINIADNFSRDPFKAGQALLSTTAGLFETGGLLGPKIKNLPLDVFTQNDPWRGGVNYDVIPPLPPSTMTPPVSPTTPATQQLSEDKSYWLRQNPFVASPASATAPASIATSTFSPMAAVQSSGLPIPIPASVPFVGPIQPHPMASLVSDLPKPPEYPIGSTTTIPKISDTTAEITGLPQIESEPLSTNRTWTPPGTEFVGPIAPPMTSLVSDLPMPPDYPIKSVTTIPEISGTTVDVTGLPQIPSKPLSTKEPSLWSKMTPGQKALGVGMAGIGTASSIYAGIQQGGVRGALTGVGGSLMSIGSLIPGPVGMGMMAAGAVMGLVNMFLPNKREKRIKEINEYMARARYVPPPSQVMSVNMEGQSVDYDMFGNLQGYSDPTGKYSVYTYQEPFNPYPYLHPGTQPLPKDAGWPPPTYTPSTPNVTTAGNSNAAPAPNITVNVPVQAIDGRSFMRYSSDIASSLQQAIKDVHPVIADVMRISRTA